MPQRANARKTLLQNRGRRQRNRAAKTRLGTETRRFLRAVERGDAQEARTYLNELTKLMHKAAAKGILHANTVARRQASYDKKLAQIATAG